MKTVEEKLKDLEVKEQERLADQLAELAKRANDIARSKRKQADDLNMQASKIELRVIELLKIKNNEITAEKVAEITKELNKHLWADGSLITNSIIHANKIPPNAVTSDMLANAKAYAKSKF